MEMILKGPEITLRQLEAFRAVVVGGSVSRAAERMAISQPAVSRLVADMEQAVGFQLFDRARRFQLSPEGKLLYLEVERAFVGVEQIARRAEDIRYFRSGHLRIAASPALSLGLLPLVLKDFRASFPAVTISAQVRSSQSVAEWAASGQIDLGFAAPPINQLGASIDPFESVAALCVVPLGHALARRETITPALLAQEQVIALGPDSLLRTKIDQVFVSAGLAVRSSIETTMSAHAAALVSQGLGVALIDPFTALSFRSADLVIKPFLPAVPYDFVMVMPEHTGQSHLAQEFAQLVAKHVSLVADKVRALYTQCRSPK
jgi:DNA-binding transcriptional LysR family regulator